MDVLTKPWRYLAAVLAVLLALAVPYALWVRGELKATAQELGTVKEAVQSLQKDAEARVMVDIKQSTQRAVATAGVRAVRAAVDKEEQDGSGAGAVFSAAELARLQRLVDAGNSAIRTAAELP